ncbi:hypothetical protein [Alkalihalobacillus sp. R86527]|uniref:hypothetical protein n=1 Tax=Alkalihalobacillus sp. R86527 TaxID=3093863 RepID=UPI00366ADB17
MAFGLSKKELQEWKHTVASGEVAFLTHFWYDPLFPQYKTVTKAGCRDVAKLIKWGEKYNFKGEWIHDREGFPHFDLLGNEQVRVLRNEGLTSHIERFHLTER